MSQGRFLAEARVGHLATADAAGAPHVIPVCFALGGQSIYSVLDEKPKRASLTGLRRTRCQSTSTRMLIEILLLL